MIDLEKWVKFEVKKLRQCYERCLVDIDLLREELSNAQKSIESLNKKSLDGLLINKPTATEDETGIVPPGGLILRSE